MAEQFVRLTLTREQAAEIRAVVRNGYDAVTFEGTINGQPIPVRIGTDEDDGDDRAELARLEAEFTASGGRGVGLAERIDALRALVAAGDGGDACPVCGEAGYTDPAECTVCADEADAVALVEELRAANPKESGRPAVPSVYAVYEALAAANGGSGNVYLDEAQSYIAERRRVPEDLLKHLGHEIYLASTQYRLARMVADEAAARAEGWFAITEIEPTDGLVLEGRTLRGNPLRLKPTGLPGMPWALLPKGKRTHGISFDALVRQHRAYEEAKERGQVAMDGPAVVMVRLAGKKA